MKRSAILLIGTLFLCSCTSLRKSQTRLIGNYFNTITNYPGNLRKLNERVAKLSLESDNLKSALYKSDSLRVRYLVEAINNYDNNLTLPDSVLGEIDSIDDYIRGYYVLVPNGFNIYKALKGTSESIVGIFGLKGVVSSILPDKSVQISNAKKRKIDEHFKSQSLKFHESLSVIKSWIDNYAIPQIDETNQEIQLNVQRLFEERNGSVSSLEHYFTYNRHFKEFFQRIISTRKLYATISVSINHIQEAEKEIQLMTNERKKIDQDSRQLHQLANDIQRMKQLLEESSF